MTSIIGLFYAGIVRLLRVISGKKVTKTQAADWSDNKTYIDSSPSSASKNSSSELVSVSWSCADISSEVYSWDRKNGINLFRL